MSAMFVVQSFRPGKRGALLPDAPAQAQNIPQAKRMAERLATKKALVVAFMRTGDPVTGEYEEPRLITALGQVPDEVREMPRV